MKKQVGQLERQVAKLKKDGRTGIRCEVLVNLFIYMHIYTLIFLYEIHCVYIVSCLKYVTHCEAWHDSRNV